MFNPDLLQQFTQLAKAESRRESATALARSFGAEGLAVYLWDQKRGAWQRVAGLDAVSGEVQILGRCVPGRVWEEKADGLLAHSPDGEVAWILSGGNPDVTKAREAAQLLPLLAAACRQEQKAREMLGIASMLEDTRSKLARALSDAEAAGRAKDEFLASLSNELRAPLNPVLMAAEAMQGDSGLPMDIRDQAEIIRRNAQLEARLIDDLLDLTRVRHGTLRLMQHPVNVHELLSQAEEVVKSDDSGKQATIEFHKRATEPWVNGDAARLQQVFWNIIRNAVKFTPQGGRVQVYTDNPRPGRVVVQVSDTGMGIEPELLSRIFDAFEKGAVPSGGGMGGLGMGLTISRAIVELHGGQVQAESAGRGRGATFSVELDTIPAPIAQTSGWPTPGIHSGASRLRILLVEDHDPTREVLGRILGRAGHKVYAAANSQEALQIVGAAAPFDAVISDLGLPDDSGFVLMKTIKAKFGLPGIAISGFGTEEDVKNAQEAGFSAHLTKPVSFEDLRAALDTVIAEKRG